jgi:uncharacterized membrane protein HdeD (DUF308 family)
MIEPVASPPAAERRTRWKWFLALGVLLLVLGIAGVGTATLLQTTTLLLFGPLILVSSLFQLLTAFFSEKGKDVLLHFVAAGLEAVLGIFVMANPPERVIGVVAVVAVSLIVIGLARLARSVASRSRGRAWTFGAGVIAVLLGITVWIGGTGAKLGFVGLCIAIDFLFHGASWSALAWAERKPDQVPGSGD